MTNEIVLDVDGNSEMTVYTKKVEELRANQITAVTYPTTQANYPSAADSDVLTKIYDKNIIVNLIRIQTRFNIDGEIDYADRAKFRYLIQKGFTFIMSYDGENYNSTIEKLSATQISRDEGTPEQITVKFSILVGKNFGSQ